MAKELLPSPTTGILMSRKFKDGDKVEPGDTVAEIECMKMVFTIDSQSTGTIHYYATEGELVSMDDIIAEVYISS